MGEMTLFIPLIIGLGLIMFLSSRRQKKAMQATIDLHESLAIGDRVHTTAGLEATITGIADDTVDLEIAPGVITTWMKLAVRDRIVEDDELEDFGERDGERDGEQDAAEYGQDVPTPEVTPTNPSSPSIPTTPASSPKTDS